MASQDNSNASRSTRCTSILTILGLVLALFTALVVYLDNHLEALYVFEPAHLHDLSKRAIGTHGNDTRAVVNYIVQELDQTLSGKYLNLDEEWIFNNAGGAMGAMYIIHASKFDLCYKRRML
jgi:C-8 sterol isomerase